MAKISQKEKIRKEAAKLWLEEKISMKKIREVFNREEIKDLKFGKEWTQKVIQEIRRSKMKELWDNKEDEAGENIAP